MIYLIQQSWQFTVLRGQTHQENISRDNFTKVFLGIFENLELLLLREKFQKSICDEVFSSDVNCSRAILIKRNSTTYVFLDIFQSFLCSYFKTSPWRHLWWSLAEFWKVVKSDSIRDKCQGIPLVWIGLAVAYVWGGGMINI